MKPIQLRRVIHQHLAITGWEYPKSVRINPDDYSELLSECAPQSEFREPGKLLLVGMEPIPDWNIPPGHVEFPSLIYQVCVG